jgi:glycosyltransferase involved in cell wall biosynthesis
VPRRRIGLVEISSGLGGSAKCVAQWLECLDQERFQAFAFVNTRKGWHAQAVASGRAAVVETHLPAPPAAPPQASLSGYVRRLGEVARMSPAVWLYLRHFRRLGIDLVHTNNDLFTHIPAILAARLASIPVICHLHVHGPLTRIEKAAIPLVDLFLVLSSRARDLYRAYIPADRIEVVPNGLLLSDYDGTRLVPPALDVRRPAVAVPGRLVQWKGQATVVRAWPRVLASVPNATLYLIGDDPSGKTGFRDELRRLVRELGCESSVVFTGWLPDPRPMLAQMDVCVCPSLEPEPFGLVVLESMILGVPVIASRHGGPLDIIDEGQDGLFFAPGDAEELAARIVSLLGDAPLASRLAQAGGDKVRGRYSIEAIVPLIEEIYERVMSRRGVGRAWSGR